MTQFKKNQRNFVAHGKGFYVSYNPHTGRGHYGGLLTDTANILLALGGVGKEYMLEDGAETALVKDNQFYILTGDFRKEYDELIPKGFKACYEFYRKMAPKYRNNWSTEALDEIK